jgi:hypothetical protein
MPNILDLISPAVATLVARQVPEPIANPLTSVLPNVPVQGRKSKSVRRTHVSTTAKFRSYDAEAPIGKRPDSIVVQELSLPAISEKLPLNEDLLLTLAEGNTEAAVARIIDSVYDDIERLTTSILNRAEQARGQFLSTGKITIAENGFIDEADFSLPVTHKAPAAILWSDPAALAIDEEMAWARTVRNDARRPVVKAVTSEAVRNYLLKNTQYRTAFWGGVANAPSLNPTQLAEVRATYGLAPLEVYEGIVPTDAGTARVIAANLFVLVTDNVGESQWGVTAEARELVASNAVDFNQTQAPGLTVVQFTVPDPVTTWTKVASIFLPVAGDINGLFVGTVTA